MKKLLLIVTLSVVLFGMASISNATSVIGVYCFQLDSYGDTYVWTVEAVGSVYQVTGYNPVYPSAMNGGGQVVSGHLLMTVDEAWPGANVQASHAIDLDLATLTGTTDLVFRDGTGTPYVTYVDLPFHNITCPVADADANNGLPRAADK